VNTNGLATEGLTYRFVLLVSVVLICMSSLDSVIGGARYIKYAVAPVLFFLWLTNRQFSYSIRPLAGYILLVVCGMFSMFMGDVAFGFKDIVFMSSYIVPLALFYTNRVKVREVFYIYIVFFLLTVPTKDIGVFSISGSSTLFEGAESFVFGAFAISFFIRKEYSYLWLALLMMMLTLKRIALLGVIICLAIWVLPVVFKKWFLSAQALLAFNLVTLTFIILLTLGGMNEIIEVITGKSATVLTLGRTSHYIGVVDDLMAHPAGVLIGNGAGSAYAKAVYNYTGDHLYANLHSDVLKIFYEYGIFVFLLFFYSMARLRTSAARVLALYLSVLFISDNVLIYSGVMFFILYLILSFEHDKSMNINNSYAAT